MTVSGPVCIMLFCIGCILGTVSICKPVEHFLSLYKAGNKGSPGRLWLAPQQLLPSTGCYNHTSSIQAQTSFSCSMPSTAWSNFTQNDIWVAVKKKVRQSPYCVTWLLGSLGLTSLRSTHRHPSPLLLDSISSTDSSHTGSKWPTLASPLLSPPCQTRKQMLRDMWEVG